MFTKVSSSDTIDAQMGYLGWDDKLGLYDQFALDIRLTVPTRFGNESMEISFFPGTDNEVGVGVYRYGNILSY